MIWRRDWSLTDGTVPLETLIDIPPNTKLLMTATDSRRADVQLVTTTAVR